MAKIIVAFIRHGDYEQLTGTPSAHQPFKLTETGEKQSQLQAQQLLQLIKNEQWCLDPIFDCSHLLRAWQTADIYRRILQPVAEQPIEVASFPQLAERSVGTAMANLSVEQISQIIEYDPRYETLPNNWKSDSHFCLPFHGAESLMMSGKRVADHITQRLYQQDRHTEKSYLKLFFGHGAAFRHAAHVLGVLKFDEIAKLSMYHAQPVMFEVNNRNWVKAQGNWKVRGAHTEYKD